MFFADMNIAQLQAIITRLDALTVVDGTSCVSLYIPLAHDASKLSTFLVQEAASGENVKNKNNRQSIGAAFRQIRQ